MLVHFALAAANTYTGDTIVQAGRLLLSSPSLANSADLYVSNAALLELNFTGSPDIIDSLFLNGASQAAGIWGAIGSGAQYTSSLLIGAGKLQVTTFIPLPLVGDYNQDGVVDAADYAKWRNNVGAAFIPNRDPSNAGVIGQADYNTWRAHYGQTVLGVTGSASAAVPEPTAVGLACWLVVGAAWYPRRPRRRS